MPTTNPTVSRLRPSMLIVSALQTALAVPAVGQQENPRETPQSDTVVDRRQLNERNVQTLGQALAYTPEASVDISGYDPRGDAVDIRGFDVTYNGIYRDGLRQTAVNLAIPRIEPYGADAVTVLRGPAVGLLGSGAPGGIVNITTKRPQFDPFGEVQLQVGNYDRYQGNFDLGGPVEGSDGSVAYRLTGIVRQAGTYLPGAPDDRVYIAPAVTWKPDADTTFTVLTEYLHTRLPSNPSYLFYPGFKVSRFYAGDPAYGTYRQDQFRVGYAFEHRFSPDLIVRQNFRYYGVGNDFPAVFRVRPVGSFTDPACLQDYRERAEVCRQAYRSRDNLGSTAVDNQVEGHVDTGPVANTLIAGVDAVRYDLNRRLGYYGYSEEGNAPALDLSMPNDSEPFQPKPLDRRIRQSEDQVGVYLQEQAKWNGFVATLSGRYDRLTSETSYTRRPDGSDEPTYTRTRQKQDDTALTYRIGLSYLLTPDIVPYASYATFFAPQPGTDPNGNDLAPATGDQFETGVKFAFPERNITGSISGFTINQASNSQRDLTTTFFQYVSGSVNSHGVEAEMTANLAPGTSLTLAYRHLDFRFVHAAATITLRENRMNVTVPVTLDGNAAAGIPGDTFSAFGTYLFPASSPLAGLTVGGGIRFIGSSFADDLNTARVSSATLFDALVAYDLAAIDPKYKGLRAQINGFNVFNRDYYSCQNVFCYRGVPATVIGSLVYRW